ncbi:ribonuclease HII [Variovorax sp. LT1P1]|uniref:ribonuclease HII n=1 Tax=Variovorax sp. LT1P1 TaxID=3443730 RepID=UPI003F48CEBD
MQVVAHELLGVEPHLLTVGVDEVGRGCLAGPVNACAYAFHVQAQQVDGLKDSKRLSPRQRAALVPILEALGHHGHGEATAAEIDELGIVAANFLAMERAVHALIAAASVSPGALHVVVDGNQVPSFPALKLGRIECLVKADDLVPAVSAASVLAKVRRDSWMAAQAAHWPGYGFESHAGYGSPVHIAAIKTLGPCSLHRMTFAPLRNAPPTPSSRPKTRPS